MSSKVGGVDLSGTTGIALVTTSMSSSISMGAEVEAPLVRTGVSVGGGGDGFLFFLGASPPIGPDLFQKTDLIESANGLITAHKEESS